MTCTQFPELEAAIARKYHGASTALASMRIAQNSDAGEYLPGHRLDKALLDTAIASYNRHICGAGSGFGPASIIVVDFAKRSNEPRLYRVDLRTGEGIDEPVLVAHGVGSDPNRDGIADVFSNVQDSLMSSLGAVRGAEVYDGRNGRSLRLDGLDYSNYNARQRDIVVHSYSGDSRRYFNASYMSDRGARPGNSEGCFVVQPERRDWLIDTLSYNGFLYAGLSGERGRIWAAQEAAREAARAEALKNQARVIFVSGTGGPVSQP